MKSACKTWNAGARSISRRASSRKHSHSSIRALSDPKQGAPNPSQRPIGVALGGGEKKSSSAITAAVMALAAQMYFNLPTAVWRSSGVRTAEGVEGSGRTSASDSWRALEPAASARSEAMPEF